MRTSALVRACSTVAAVVLAGTLLTPPAVAAEPAPPVAVPDTVTLWPGQATQLNVLANDVSSSGDDLALCRFPAADVFSEKTPAVIVTEVPPILGGAVGEVMVGLAPRARGTHVIDYYVCDHTHLVPSSLTVVVREVRPIEVRKVRGKPGRLRVTNHNAVPIRFWYGHPRADDPDGRVRIAPARTVTVRVQRHRIVWIALIGAGSTKADSLGTPGIAGLGAVRDIRIAGEPLPAPPKHGPDSVEGALGRWR